MAKTDNAQDFVKDIADTIRYETQTEEKINPQNFSNKISGFQEQVKTLNSELEGLFTPYEQKTTYGVKLDKSILTGTEWGSYTDDAVGLDGAYMDFTNDVFVDNGWKDRFPFNQIKPCLMKNNQVVGYLNPNDYTKFEDGTDADITNLTVENNGFVMVEIPKIYYHISKDDGFIYIKISDKAQEGFVCNAHTYKGQEVDKIYVSAYLCGTDNIDTVGFIMPSGASVSKNVYTGYEFTWGKLQSINGERYEHLPYNVAILIQCLYAIMFKNTNSQLSLGAGYSSNQTTHAVGSLNQKGMYYGTSAYGTSVKFLGLEGIYGTRKQVCVGFYRDKNNQGRYIDVHNPNISYGASNLNDYLISDGFVVASKYSRTTIDVNEDAINVGFFGAEVSTDKYSGFCDSSSLTSSTTTTCADYGIGGSTTANGIYAMTLVISNDTAKNKSARVVYYPEK